MLTDVLPKLKQFETMTWAEVEAGGSHSIEVTALAANAVARLLELRIDDVDSLFSLRLSGKVRVFGIKDGAILRVLWWDPQHAICPAPKKHT